MTIERWLDSATPPTAAQIAAARAAGYRGWAGYLATRPGTKLANPWPAAAFRAVLDGGLLSLAYVSGWDDPAAVKAAAAKIGIPAGLDVESSIRADGPWVQPWLDASGAGLYGHGPVHAGRRAAFHILTGGPYWTGGTPATVVDWYPALAPRPAGLCGWQWRGTHPEFGDGVDDSYFCTGLGGNPPKEIDMVLLNRGGTNEIWLLGAAFYTHVLDGPDLVALRSAGIPEATSPISEGQHQALLAEIAKLGTVATPIVATIPVSISGTGNLKVGG